MAGQDFLNVNFVKQASASPPWQPPNRLDVGTTRSLQIDPATGRVSITTAKPPPSSSTPVGYAKPPEPKGDDKEFRSAHSNCQDNSLLLLLSDLNVYEFIHHRRPAQAH